MGNKEKLALVVIAIFAFCLLLFALLNGKNIELLNPKGIIAHKELNLLIFASLLSLIVVIPVFVMTFYIAYKYRESNTKSKYSPDWDHNAKIEAIWWGVPLVLICILSVVTWNSSHTLDPSRPIVSAKKPINIQVVALEWKWLFIYPQQGIATVNYFEIPVDTPVSFDITSDAPMNSFWIPQLGGQIYAMSGMSTKLHLEADTIGDYTGKSANISGSGFAGMHFTARASSTNEFTQWVSSVKQSPQSLTQSEYTKLAQPSSNVPPTFYTSPAQGLYDTIVLNFVQPSGTSGGN